MAKIRDKERAAILNALAGGVTPRQGIQHIQVGRADETAALIEDIKRIENGESTMRIISGNYGGGKTFMLTLTKSIALKRNLLVMQVDFSPDRRLYSSSGKAKNLYRELVRSLSSQMTPDGGALEELIDAIDEKVSIGDRAFLADIRKLPYGFDAITVLSRWHSAKHPANTREERDAFLVQDACLRWFASENTVEHKKLLGVKESIGDSGAYDALKLIAALAHHAGYGGLLVELDECVNLFKINDSTSRDRNYEQILRIFNETRQGDAHYIGFVLGGTPEFVMDPRRGLFSYDALRSRLVTSRYAEAGAVDIDAPIIELQPLSQESLLVLLGNIVNVQACGDKSRWLMTNEDMELFMRKCFDSLGADYYRKPRELIRDFVAILRKMETNPEMTAAEAIGESELTQTPARTEGSDNDNNNSESAPHVKSRRTGHTAPQSVIKAEEEDGGFGF